MGVFKKGYNVSTPEGRAALFAVVRRNSAKAQAQGGDDGKPWYKKLTTYIVAAIAVLAVFLFMPTSDEAAGTAEE